MANKLKLKKTYENFNIRSFKEPTCDINDEVIKKKELEEFIKLEKINKQKESEEGVKKI